MQKSVFVEENSAHESSLLHNDCLACMDHFRDIENKRASLSFFFFFFLNILDKRNDENFFFPRYTFNLTHCLYCTAEFMTLPLHGELFSRFLLFFLPTFVLICIWFTLPKRGKHLCVTIMYCRSHNFARHSSTCTFETSRNSVNSASKTTNEIKYYPDKPREGETGIAISDLDVARWI